MTYLENNTFKRNISLDLELDEEGNPLSPSTVIILDKLIDSNKAYPELFDFLSSAVLSMTNFEISNEKDTDISSLEPLKPYLVMSSAIKQQISFHYPDVDVLIHDNVENKKEFESIVDDFIRHILGTFGEQLDKEKEIREKAEKRAKEAEALFEEERIKTKEAEARADEERNRAEEIEKKLKEQLLENDSFVLSTTNKTQRKLRATKTANLSTDIMGNANISAEDFSLMLANYEKGISTNAKITLDIFLKEFCSNETPDGLIQLPLRDYMEIRGLSDSKTARKQVLYNIEEVKKIRFSCTELNKSSKKKEFMGGIDLYGGTGLIQKGIIRFRFNPDYLRFRNLTHFFINYPKEIYRINVKYFPYSYYFGCYIAENFRMNEGRERVNIISIKTLLEYTPTIPTKDEVSKGNRRYFDRIIEPTIRNLDQLDSIGYDFYPKGKYDEADRIDDPLSFFKGEEGTKEFFNSVIMVDYSNFPTNPERLEKRKKHLSKQAKTTKKNTKKGG